MVILDCETTELLMPEVADLASQPHIIEIAMLKMTDDYKEVDRYEALINPGVPIDDEQHKKITGLSNADLADAPAFIELLDELRTFFLGEGKMIAHNLEFDLGMLVVELRRVGQEFAFPYPPQQVCTVVNTKHLKGKRLKLTELYEMKIGKPYKQTHRAMDDVLALAEIVKEMQL